MNQRRSGFWTNGSKPILAGWGLLAGLLLGGASNPVAALTPEQIDFAIQELDRQAPRLLERSGVPGMALAVVSRDQVHYVQGFGVREQGLADPVDPDTVFQLASVSKPLTSTLIAGLVGEGLVDWDTPVRHLLPEFALADAWVSQSVTLADLLAHRSGLPGHIGDLLEDLGFGREEILARLRGVPLLPFRATHAYTNFGFTAAALAAAAAVGTPWADLADQQLFEPLGLSQTSFRQSDYLAAENRAMAHAYRDGRYQPLFERDAEAQAPAGGASSSARELARWLQWQLGEGTFAVEAVIAAEALRQTHRPWSVSHPARTAAERSGFYGLGWNLGYDSAGRVRLNHSGAFLLGVATTVTFYPGEDIGILVLTNGAPYGLPEAVAQTFFDLLFLGESETDRLTEFFDAFRALWAEERAFLRDYSRPPEAPVPALPVSAYPGIYDNPYYGPLKVAARDQELSLVFGPQRQVFPLRHWSGSLYVFETMGENALGLSGAEFLADPQGVVQQVILERYNKLGLGSFVRRPGPGLPPPPGTGRQTGGKDEK